MRVVRAAMAASGALALGRERSKSRPGAFSPMLVRIRYVLALHAKRGCAATTDNLPLIMKLPTPGAMARSLQYRGETSVYT
jgi:hypothetical protein